MPENNMWLLRRLAGDQSKFEYLQMVLGSGSHHVMWTENAKEAAHFCTEESAKLVANNLGAYDVLVRPVISQRCWVL